MISSSCEVQLVNEKIVTFLLVKLCYNGSSDNIVELCDMMDSLIEPDKSAGCVQKLRCGKRSIKIYTCSLRYIIMYVMVCADIYSVV